LSGTASDDEQWRIAPSESLRSLATMPHLVILYTPQLDRDTDMTGLCRKLADTMIGLKDEAGKAVFPVGGTRVLAYPAAHHAVADSGVAARAQGKGEDCAFAYFNLRMGRGRSDAVKRAAGESLVAVAREHLAPVLERRPVGLTLQVDEGQEAFDGKFGNLHALFAGKS
jgi:5-carboxymethyl-2-hydroxymuconate isomerase